MGPVKHRRFLTMACWGSVFRDYRNPLIGARRLSIDDAVDLARVKAEQGTPLDPGEVILRLASPHWHYYGAFVNGELASIATTYLKLPEVWVIGDVYTRARYRGIGAGKAVTAAVTKDALTSGAMAMLHVDEDNEPAVRVYRRIGYRVVRVEDWLASSPLRGVGGFLAQSSLASLAGFMGLPRASIAGLSSLALNSLSVACICFTISFGTNGFELPSRSSQSILFLKSHHTPFAHASGVVFHVIFTTDA